MQGKVKWFSEEKGYGFIVDESGTDHHFSVRSVKGAELPRTGSLVTFDSESGRKGPRAVNVIPIARSTAPVRRARASTRSERADDRVTCAACDRRMVPRIITGPPLVHGRGSWTPVPKRSVCPFCGATFQKFPASAGEKVGLIVFLTVLAIFALTICTAAGSK